MVDAPSRPSRKGKERETFASDFTDRMVALQRRNHQPITTRRERPTISTATPPTTTASPPRKGALPQVVVSAEDEFSRRLNIASSNSPPTRPSRQAASAAGKSLFNPHADAPMRRTAEPDAISDSTTSSNKAAVPPPQQPSSAPRQLFDPRRDDPVRFSAHRKPPPPTPKSSGDYGSSASSYYAPSVASSSFTLSSSTTEGSSDPSSIFDSGRPEQPSKPSNAFTVQLKKLYRDITTLETKLKNDEGDGEAMDESRVLPKPQAAQADEGVESAKWQRLIQDHKLLAEMMHQLLGISTAPSVPASLRSIPEKYSIVVRLWTYGFHRLLENLRRSALNSSVALEHLQDFIYFAYTFYASLYEEHNLAAYRAAWLEALGDLARYRMAVAAMLPHSALYTPAPAPMLSTLAPPVAMTPTSTSGLAGSNGRSDVPAGPARIDDSPSPSVGIVAARNFEMEPEKERWRAAARAWYGAGVADTPGNGKLHHHLGLLAREAEGEDLRAVYHFTKSLIATHPFATSRESALPIWTGSAQTRRAQPDATASDLFVRLHGTLFTAVERDAFAPTLSRLSERLSLTNGQVESREWAMMACANVASLLEYGKKEGVLKRAGAFTQATGVGQVAQAQARMKIASARARGDDGMDVDEPSPALSEASVASSNDGLPAGFALACQLAFTMLAHAVSHPVPARDGRPAPSAYATVLLTFLAVLAKTESARAVLERFVPWEQISAMLQHAPTRILKREDGSSERLNRRGALPEDWCLRGMGWPGRNLFEKGFWRAEEGVAREMEVLDEREGAELENDEGRVEEEGEEEEEELGARRWARAVWAGARLARLVPGFAWRGGKEWAVEGVLREKVVAWGEEERREREEEEMRRSRVRGADSMEVDDDEAVEEDSEDDEGATEEVRALKARRRYLRSLLRPSAAPSRPSPRRQARNKMPGLRLSPGYTTLVLDTNVLLAAPERVRALIESQNWIIVVPLPVIMELDGLASASSTASDPFASQSEQAQEELGKIAKSAVDMLSSLIRTHSSSLKVQTSRGNYLSSLVVRRESVDFDGSPGGWERCMDDLILRAAVWQDEHWVDRSGSEGMESASRVVLCTLDRNLRVKARARQLDAAGEEEIAALLAGA
ncbi:hypothetical protein PENSPDRAFT_655393 [Peniophora sp. CONT]|nr:hypothetical protein PENSPDRAFT_655393 [Peniophora sp. CONT]